MVGLEEDGLKIWSAKCEGIEVFWRFFFPPRLAGKRVFTPFRPFPIILSIFYVCLPHSMFRLTPQYTNNVIYLQKNLYFS